MPSTRNRRLLLIGVVCLIKASNAFQNNVGHFVIIDRDAKSGDGRATTSSSSHSSTALHLISPHFQNTLPNLNKNAMTTTTSAAKHHHQRLGITSHDRLSSTQLSLSPTSSSVANLYAPLASLGVVAFVILIHELGHFLAARGLGIRVKEFSVGVGPKIAGFRRSPNGGAVLDEFDDDDEAIEFNLRAIPFGGYVSFPENYNRTLVMEVEVEEMRRERREREEGVVVDVAAQTASTRNPGERLSVFGLFNKKEKTPTPKAEVPLAKKATWFGFGQGKERMAAKEAPAAPPQKTSWWQLKKPSKTTTSPPTPPPTAPVIEYYTDPDLLQNRPWTQRAVVLAGGVVFNLLLAFACYFGELTVGPGLPRPVVAPGAIVSSMPRTDGASYGVLQRGDVIVGINGDVLALSDSNSYSSAKSSISSLITTIRSTPPGSSLTLSIIPSSNTPSTMATTPTSVTITPRSTIDADGNLGPTSIGVTLSPNILRTELIRYESLPQSLLVSGETVYRLTSDSLRAVTQLISSAFLGTAAPGGGGSVSGPVGIIRSGSDVVASGSLPAVVAFGAAMSVNLAVMNSLPFPGLDGGQMVFVLSEAVTRRKVDQRVQERINAYALLVLLIVSVGATVGDVGDLIRR